MPPLLLAAAVASTQSAAGCRCSRVESAAATKCSRTAWSRNQLDRVLMMHLQHQHASKHELPSDFIKEVERQRRSIRTCRVLLQNWQWSRQHMHQTEPIPRASPQVSAIENSPQTRYHTYMKQAHRWRFKMTAGAERVLL